MKKNNRHFVFMVVTTVFASTINAQIATRSEYFMENSMHNHQLNPAFTSNRNYFELPAIGGINITTNSNIGIDAIIYPNRGRNKTMATFMHPFVGSQEFLDKIKKSNNKTGADIAINILSVGFRKWGGYNTIGLTARCAVSSTIPKQLFEFAKLGKTSPEGTHYDLSNTGVKADAYIELALGHQHRINDNWAIGGKLKLLFGGAHADATIYNMDVIMNQNQWQVTCNGDMNIAVRNARMKTKTSKSDPKQQIFNGIDDAKAGLNGFGAAIDLGFTYKADFCEGLELSAALLDLGFISWFNNVAGDSNGKWTHDGFMICSDNGALGHEDHTTLSDQCKQVRDDIQDLLNFKPINDRKSRTTVLGAMLNVGIAYKLPMYKHIKIGALCSSRINGRYSWTEGRVSANWNPCEGFDLAVNYAYSSFGHSFGWMINYATKGFGVYLGMDHTPFEFTKQWAPMDGRANLAFGITFPLGNKM